jgi:glycosyltransferase involved in cell wall biosynthesis
MNETQAARLSGPLPASATGVELRILTTTIKETCPQWNERTQLLPGWAEEVNQTWAKRKPASLGSDLRWGWRLFRASRDYDVVVTGFENPSLVFGFLQLVLRFRRTPHVFLYVNFNLPRSWLARTFRRFMFRQIIRTACRIIVHSVHQGRLYAEAFDMPREKFVPLKYYHGLYEVSYPSSQGDYVFAGGDYTRDYANLIEAVRCLPYRVVIACFYRHYFQGTDIPKHVEVVTVSHDEFMRLMAGAGAVVVPLEGGLLHPGGHLTYLSAMCLGKAVIVTDDGGADEYIVHGQTGLLVRPGDPVALREAIGTLMEQRELARGIGARARAEGQKYTIDQFLDGVLATARCCGHCQGCD